MKDRHLPFFRRLQSVPPIAHGPAWSHIIIQSILGRWRRNFMCCTGSSYYDAGLTMNSVASIVSLVVVWLSIFTQKKIFSQRSRLSCLRSWSAKSLRWNTHRLYVFCLPLLIARVTMAASSRYPTSSRSSERLRPLSCCGGLLPLEVCWIGILKLLLCWQTRVLLVSSAFSMGGVSIWCMHYIGNRAITLYEGQRGLQLSYGAGFTVLSFFMPVVVLLLAYVIIGGVENARIWRLAIGGTVAGAAICGMHYLVNDVYYKHWHSGTTINNQLQQYIQRWPCSRLRYNCHFGDQHCFNSLLQTAAEVGWRILEASRLCVGPGWGGLGYALDSCNWNFIYSYPRQRYAGIREMDSHRCCCHCIFGVCS